MKQEGKKAMKGAVLSGGQLKASSPWGLPKEPHKMCLRMTPPNPGKPRYFSVDSPPAMV